MRAVRSRLTYANVVATLALMLALGGTAVAAKHYVITSSTQIKPGAIALTNLAPAARSALRGRPGPAGTTGATGASGAAGSAGQAGPQGVAGATFVSVTDYPGTGTIPTDGSTTTVLSSAAFTAEPHTLYQVIRDGKEWSAGPTGPDCTPPASSGATTHVTVNGVQVGGGATTYIGPYSTSTPIAWSSDVTFCNSTTTANNASHHVYVLAFRQ